LNDKLKKEYLNQMELFGKLRDKYNEKVMILTKENQRLKEAAKENQPEPAGSTSQEIVIQPNGVAPEETNGILQEEKRQVVEKSTVNIPSASARYQRL
ncbi:hypothetical protein GE061_017492, partial [Apolygus lucorum]